MQIKSDETEDEETIASSSCLPTTQTYGSDQVATLAALKRALQHAFKLVSRGQNLAKIVILSRWRSLQILAKLIFQHALVSLQQCHEYIKFRLADEPHRESADKPWAGFCFMYVCCFICSSCCIMHNMSVQVVLGSLAKETAIPVTLSTCTASTPLPKLKTKEIPVSEIIHEIYLRISLFFFQNLIRVWGIFVVCFIFVESNYL